jgi:hypothetical protein
MDDRIASTVYCVFDVYDELICIFTQEEYAKTYIKLFKTEEVRIESRILFEFTPSINPDELGKNGIPLRVFAKEIIELDEKQDLQLLD